MAYTLNGMAEYIPEGDMIQVQVYLMDDADGKAYPHQALQGTFELMAGDTVVQYSRSFNGKRFACMDGSFRFDVSHPAQNFGLTARITILLADATTRLVANIPVTKDTSGEGTQKVLAQQPQVPSLSYGLVKTGG